MSEDLFDGPFYLFSYCEFLIITYIYYYINNISQCIILAHCPLTGIGYLIFSGGHSFVGIRIM